MRGCYFELKEDEKQTLIYFQSIDFVRNPDDSLYSTLTL